MRGLEQGLEVLDRRLDHASSAPIAVALSGGGDSLAALHLAKSWADRRGRRVLALTVDHHLQAESGEWTRFAAAAAARAGAEFRALDWEAPGRGHGLPAAARDARHRLIAEAARGAGAQVVVFGHTADDVLEARRMRSQGLRLGTPGEWSPSPSWPQGRGLFLLRPLLGVRRAAIREVLRARGLAWIDDPANIDPASPRARARLALAGAGEVIGQREDDPALAELARSVLAPAEGYLRIDRDRLRHAEAGAARRLLAAAALSVGGKERPPRGERTQRLLALATSAGPFQATLAGARIIGAEDLLVVRDAGEAQRGGLAPLRLSAGAPAVWDGRFELSARGAGVQVRPLAGAMRRLDPAQRRALMALPAAARPGLPVLDGGAEPLFCPIFGCMGPVHANALVAARFLAACGAISKEPAA